AEAERCYRNALRLEPENRDALNNLRKLLASLGKPANRISFLAGGGLGTTSCAHELRQKNGDYEKYLVGKGIDIGGGYDCLETPHGTVVNWDVTEGDAKDMSNVPDNEFDFVYSSHCLEH